MLLNFRAFRFQEKGKRQKQDIVIRNNLFFVTKTCYKTTRFVYDSRTKRSKRSSVKQQADSDTDHWNGGKTYMSDDEDDDKMATLLDRNTSFLINMSKTGGFTVPCFTFLRCLLYWWGLMFIEFFK